MRYLIKTAIIILFSSFFIMPLYAMNRGDLRDECRRLLRDTDTTNQRWTDTVLNTRINYAQKEFVKRTRCIEVSTYTTTIVGVSTYAINSSNILASRRVSYAIKPLTTTTTYYKEMEYMTKEGMDTKYPYWESADGSDPKRYFYEADRIVIYPKPSTTTYAGYNFLKHEYYALADDMDDDTDVPFNGLVYLYSYHETLKWYVCYLCAIDTNDTAAQSSFFGNFEKELGIAKSEFGDRPDKRGGFSVK
ncbi:MAG: hypothetical protein WC390_08990 [Sulfurimonas sp.]|jgi:hypothetical protein